VVFVAYGSIAITDRRTGTRVRRIIALLYLIFPDIIGTIGCEFMFHFELDKKLIALSELFNTFPQVQTVFLFGSYGTEIRHHSVILILPSSSAKI